MNPIKTILLFFGVVLAFANTEAQNVNVMNETFESIAIGEIPKNWESFSAISSYKKDIVSDGTTHVLFETVQLNGNKFLKLSKQNNSLYDDGHMCYSKRTEMVNGEISVDIMCSDTLKGHGGVAFRIKDYKNYYAVRISLIEGNVLIQKIKDGVAFPTKKFNTPEYKGSGKWVNLKVAFSENNFKITVDNKQTFEYIDETDPLIAAGATGVFSRGEVSIISWDNFIVTKKD